MDRRRRHRQMVGPLALTSHWSTVAPFNLIKINLFSVRSVNIGGRCNMDATRNSGLHKYRSLYSEPLNINVVYKLWPGKIGSAKKPWNRRCVSSTRLVNRFQSRFCQFTTQIPASSTLLQNCSVFQSRVSLLCNVSRKLGIASTPRSGLLNRNSSISQQKMM